MKLTKYVKQALDYLYGNKERITRSGLHPLGDHVIDELTEKQLVTIIDEDDRTIVEMTEEGEKIAAILYAEADDSYYLDPVSGRKMTPAEKHDVEQLLVKLTQFEQNIETAVKQAKTLERLARNLKLDGMISVKKNKLGQYQNIKDISEFSATVLESQRRLMENYEDMAHRNVDAIRQLIKGIDERIK